MKRLFYPLLVALVLTAPLTGCGDNVIVDPPSASGASDFLLGVNLQVSSGTATVNGESVLQRVRQDSSLLLTHHQFYDHGTLNEQRKNEFWGVTLGHNTAVHDRASRTFVFDMLDYGDVSLGGVALNRQTESPDGGGAGVTLDVRQWVYYHQFLFSEHTDLDGSSRVHFNTPVMDDLLQGRDVALQATGSGDVAATEATFSLRPFARIASLTNVGDLDFRQARPDVSTAHDLVLTFDRTLDPGEVLLGLHPFVIGEPGVPVEIPRNTYAMLQLNEATDRVTIAASDLQTLRANARAAFELDDVPYGLLFFQVYQDRGSIESTNPATGAPLGLPIIQSADTQFTLRLVD